MPPHETSPLESKHGESGGHRLEDIADMLRLLIDAHIASSNDIESIKLSVSELTARIEHINIRCEASETRITNQILQMRVEILTDVNNMMSDNGKILTSISQAMKDCLIILTNKCATAPR